MVNVGPVSYWQCQRVFRNPYDTLPNLPEHYASRLAKFKVEKATRNHILFLGNSITEGGNWRKLLGDSTVINRGISGDNTLGFCKG